MGGVFKLNPYCRRTFRSLEEESWSNISNSVIDSGIEEEEVVIHTAK
jgi:hypothetical protein